MFRPDPNPPLPPTYHVGLYAVVQREQRVLLLEYSSGVTGLPGTVHTDAQASAEEVLRRAIMTQAGVAVDQFTLLGSRTFVNTLGALQVNLVFKADYVSGLPNPSTNTVDLVEWAPVLSLATRTDVTDLTRDAVMRANTAPPTRGRR